MKALAQISLVVFAVMLCLATTAQALQTYNLDFTFGSGEFVRPYPGCLDIDDSDGNVYVTDNSLSRMKEFTATGTYLNQMYTGFDPARTGGYGCVSPGGMTIGPGGMYMVSADSWYLSNAYGAVSKYAVPLTFPPYHLNTTPVATWYSGDGNCDVAIDHATGDVYVSPYGAGVINRYDSTGLLDLTFTPIAVTNAKGIEVDQADGSLYVCEYHHVLKFDSTGLQVGDWGDGITVSDWGNGDMEFTWPDDIALDSNGNVYVADSGNGRVVKFDPGTGLFPSGTLLANIDALGSAGALWRPTALSVAANGKVYVVEADGRLPLGKYVAVFEPLDTVPDANAGPDQTVEQTDYLGTDVTLDGSGSDDEDGDPITTYSWVLNAVQIATGVGPTVSLPLGEHTITLTVTGDEGSDSDDVDITVEDTTPPTITQLGLLPIGKSKAEYEYKVLATATDICDPDPEITATLGLAVEDAVRVNLPPGQGRGHLLLKGADGEFVLTAVATDASDNQSAEEVSVVPLN